MKHFSKKLFAMLLCVMLCGSLVQVYAETKDPFYEGTGPRSCVSYFETRSTGGTLGLTVRPYGAQDGYEDREYRLGWNYSVKLRVSVTCDSAVTYQWYTVDNPEDIGWDGTDFTFKARTKISGATKSSYKPPVNSDDQRHYYVCTVKDKNGDDASALFSVYNWYYQIDDPIAISYPTGVFIPNMFCNTFAKGSYHYDSGPVGRISVDDGYVMGYAERYQIYRKESGSKWKALKTVTETNQDGGTTEYTDTTAKMGVTYAYKYCSYLNGAWVPFSNPVSVTFNPFYDVSLDEERAQYIAWAYNNDVIKGSLDDSGHRLFKPDDSCTRMNFVMILWKMHGKPSVSETNPFSDVSGNTSVKAVTWAVKKKLVTGTSATTFSPENNLSRINIIMILYKLAGSPKVSAESPYEDISGSKTSKAVNWAVGKEIISPVDETHFAPDDNCSRALLVEILCKYNEIYKIL